MTRTALVIAAVGLLAPAALAQLAEHPAPADTQGQANRPSGAQPKAAKPALEPIYDEAADAKEQIAAALTRARKENRRVLIQWGGNWCGWCRLLHRTMTTDKAIRKELQYEYDVVMVDIGRWNKNMDLAEKYGADLKTGVPYLTILDSSGEAVANQRTDPLELKGEDGNSIQGEHAGHDPAKVLAFLKSHEAKPVAADSVVSSAVAAANDSHKKVFLHFGAPWCPWCHRLDDWLARGDIAPLIAKDYVEVKVDQDRMPGAKEVEDRFGMPENSGIPWFAIIDPATGKALASSTNDKGENIGFPAKDEEIAHFMAMLGQTHKDLSAADLETIKRSLAGEQSKPSGH